MAEHEVFVHEVRVRLGDGADPAALGGAVTSALCGHWEHEPPCTWPHHSTAKRLGDETVCRAVFLAPPAEEPEVRRRIDDRLAAGSLLGPDGRMSSWRHLGSSVADPTPADLARANGFPPPG